MSTLTPGAETRTPPLWPVPLTSTLVLPLSPLSFLQAISAEKTRTADVNSVNENRVPSFMFRLFSPQRPVCKRREYDVALFGSAERPRLLRVVSRWEIVALSINDVIGSGVYLLPAESSRHERLTQALRQLERWIGLTARS